MSDPSAGVYYWFEGDCPLCAEPVDTESVLVGVTAHFLCPECLWPVEVIIG